MAVADDVPPCISGWCQKVTVTQSDRLLILRDGQPVNMSCHQDSKDNYVALWYLKKPNQALQLMVSSPDPKDIDMEATYNSWELRRPSQLWSSLSKSSAKTEDSAVYFCASSRHSCKHQSIRLHKTCM
ncbi:hypothetical protein GDO78_014543 [Eleutherodactylus coqui]|uniref:Immunoglobulin V-set domain-containing protein n=1 Tax=Eleutherodactylus coqui TaxID=57060 RepID=A0A8J6K176_ELECQ|nr:hypothetical protein GDO78_014543 [Eleutherodactylus coqui]